MFVSLVAMGILSYHAFGPEPQIAGRSPAERPKTDESDESDLGEIFRIIFWCGVPATLLALGGASRSGLGTRTNARPSLTAMTSAHTIRGLRSGVGSGSQ